jgi:predicted DNA binding protein
MIGEIQLSHPRMALMGTIQGVPESTIETAWYPLLSPDRWVGFYRVTVSSDADFDGFEAALAADETVVDSRPVATATRGRVYRIEISSDALLIMPELVERGGGLIGARSTDGGWLVRVQLPDRRTFVAFRRSCAERGVDFRTERLYGADDLDTAETGLTEPQRQLLLAAYEAGYFEEPRAITLEGLGQRLGISSTAAGGRLRRAMGRLVEAQFAELEGHSSS